MSPHAASRPKHVAVHLPLPHVIAPHAAAPFEHVSVHAPSAQVSAPQAPAPEHVRAHTAAPVHVIAPHAPAPVHVAAQVPLAHVMSPHALESVHVNWHSKPAGHVLPPLMLQRAGNVAMSQPPVHSSGHTNASAGGGASIGSVPVTQ
jgi:hypothetical protein